MFSFNGSPVPVRANLRDAHEVIWAHFARPGQVLDARERHSILSSARDALVAKNAVREPSPLHAFAMTLFVKPPSVSSDMVSDAIAGSGEAALVETIALVSMLAAVDNTHSALGVALEPLPEPLAGDPTHMVATGMKRRRTHVPMPRNSITVALEYLPVENEAYAAACGPHYMTFAEMASPIFGRSPGLNRAQLETIASRTSLINECFY
jgi:hypothetical protein